MQPDSRWTVRGPGDDVAGLVQRAAAFIESLGRVRVRDVSLARDGDDAVLTVVFDHRALPADLDYLDPRVAAGHFTDAQRLDVDLMVQLAAEIEARTVVDLGCGTGQLAVALAERGCHVVGVDPAKAMLDRARGRPGGHLVEWVLVDISAVEVADGRHRSRGTSAPGPVGSRAGR